MASRIVLLGFLGILSLTAGIAYTHRPIKFDPTMWRNSPGQRPRMVRSLLDDHNLNGMPRERIHDLLGQPTGPRDSEIDGRYVYWAGSDGVIDDMWFEVRFENDIVSNVRYVPD